MIGPRIGRVLCPWLFAPLAQLEAAAVAGRLGHGWLISGPAGIGKRICIGSGPRKTSARSR